MKNKKTLTLLSATIASIGTLGYLEGLPFIPKDIAVAIIGISTVLTPLIITVGDLLDDGKLNKSFKG